MTTITTAHHTITTRRHATTDHSNTTPQHTPAHYTITTRCIATAHHTNTTPHHHHSTPLFSECAGASCLHHPRLSLGSCCAANTCSHTFQNLEYPCGDSLLILVIRSHQQMFLRIQNKLLPRETEKRTGESCELLLSAPEISYCRVEGYLNDSLGVMRITVTILGHCFLPQIPSTSTTAAAS